MGSAVQSGITGTIGGVVGAVLEPTGSFVGTTLSGAAEVLDTEGGAAFAGAFADSKFGGSSGFGGRRGGGERGGGGGQDQLLNIGSLPTNWWVWLLGIAVIIGLVIILTPRSKRKRRRPRTKTAKQRRDEALAKGRRTAARNRRAKAKKRK